MLRAVCFLQVGARIRKSFERSLRQAIVIAIAAVLLLAAAVFALVAAYHALVSIYHFDPAEAADRPCDHQCPNARSEMGTCALGPEGPDINACRWKSERKGAFSYSTPYMRVSTGRE